VSFAQPGWSSEESSRHSGAQAETNYSVRWGITGTASSLMSGRIRDVGLCVLGPRMFVLRIVGRWSYRTDLSTLLPTQPRQHVHPYRRREPSVQAGGEARCKFDSCDTTIHH
jgi:hypothetical protein